MFEEQPNFITNSKNDFAFVTATGLEAVVKKSNYKIAVNFRYFF